MIKVAIEASSAFGARGPAEPVEPSRAADTEGDLVDSREVDEDDDALADDDAIATASAVVADDGKELGGEEVDDFQLVSPVPCLTRP